MDGSTSCTLTRLEQIAEYIVWKLYVAGLPNTSKVQHVYNGVSWMGHRQSKAAFPLLICTILIHEGFLACTNCHIYIFVAVWAYYNPSKSRTSTKLPKDLSKNDQALLVGIWPKPAKWVLKINIISSIPRSLLRPHAWSNGSSMETKGYLPIQSWQHSGHVSCQVHAWHDASKDTLA